MRLIDAELAIEYLTKLALESEEPWMTSAITTICRFLDSRPTVEEVVQCKDCGHRLENGQCLNFGFVPNNYWYCANGWRRKDEFAD